MTAPLTYVIFGASGDLTSRKLIPALYRLDVLGLLPEGSQIVGVARSSKTAEQFRAEIEPKVKGAVLHSGEPWYAGTWTHFSRRLHYVAADASRPDGVQTLENWLKNRENNGPGNRVYYASVSPELYPDLATRLGEAGMSKEDAGFRRLVIEKPFGTNLESAMKLNEVLHSHWRERQIYRIDHYLGKDTVQNILVFRYANVMFEPLWNYQYIDHVQLTVAEKVDAKDRWKFYNPTNVLRDMFQSHILQTMTMLAMEYPSRLIAERIRNEKMKVLESIQIPKREDAHKFFAVGQYAGYRQHDPSLANSKCPTFAAIKFYIDNPRWQGVPFYLRSGKALKARYSEIVIQFRKPAHLMFPLPPGQELSANRLRIEVQPNESIHLNFQVKVPSVGGMELQPQDLSFRYRDSFKGITVPEAYERLLLDSIQGEASLFMRSDEIERAWEIMDPIIGAAESDSAPDPEIYPMGSEGPKCAHDLLAADGRKWQPIP